MVPSAVHSSTTCKPIAVEIYFPMRQVQSEHTFLFAAVIFKMLSKHITRTTSKALQNKLPGTWKVSERCKFRVSLSRIHSLILTIVKYCHAYGTESALSECNFDFKPSFTGWVSRLITVEGLKPVRVYIFARSNL